MTLCAAECKSGFYNFEKRKIFAYFVCIFCKTEFFGFNTINFHYQK